MRRLADCVIVYFDYGITMNNVVIALFAIFLASISPQVAAIEISMIGGNHTSTIVVTGPIEHGDAERFKEYWENNAHDSYNFTVALDSPGGSLLDGMKIGRFLREVGAHTEIKRYSTSNLATHQEMSSTARCYSACALAFMGGVKREIPRGGSIGFHQFYDGEGSSTGSSMELSQYISALVAGYLREMGANSRLFELMSGTSPNKMFIPARNEILSLNIIPQPGFHDFQLLPRNEVVVASAIDAGNPNALQKVYEIETSCLNGTPVINLYALNDRNGLSAETVSMLTAYEGGGFKIITDFGVFEYGIDRLKLYSRSKILASLIIDRNVARAISSGSSSVSVNSFSVSGALLSGEISSAPGGDPAIRASLRNCF